jgi:F0F1-type ATP synthase epsilon subunit
VLCDHMPMFCELGLGMMEIESVSEEAGKPQTRKAFVVIDTGFALVGQNLATIVSSDAFSSTDIKKEKIERVIERIEKKKAAAGYTPDQQEHETEKVELLKKLLVIIESGAPDMAGKSSA